MRLAKINDTLLKARVFYHMLFTPLGRCSAHLLTLHHMSKCSTSLESLRWGRQCSLGLNQQSGRIFSASLTRRKKRFKVPCINLNSGGVYSIKVVSYIYVLPQSSGKPTFFLQINEIALRITSWRLRIIS